MEQVGVDHAVGAVDLGAVVHAAGLGPALLGHADRAAAELDDDDRVVVAAGLVAVDEGAHRRA